MLVKVKTVYESPSNGQKGTENESAAARDLPGVDGACERGQPGE
jgi:hypothetical protein